MKNNFGKADPDVKIALDKQKTKSATVKNNHTPEWNFEAAVDIKESTTENITNAAFDDDFDKDDSLVNAIVDISKVQEHKQLFNQWIPLERYKSGEILISAKLIPQLLVQKEKDLEPLKTIEKNEDILKQKKSVYFKEIGEISYFPHKKSMKTQELIETFKSAIEMENKDAKRSPDLITQKIVFMQQNNSQDAMHSLDITFLEK